MTTPASRRLLVVANWKMNKTTGEAASYVRRLAELFQPQSIDVVLAPPFTALQAAAQAMGPSTTFALAGQDLFWEDKGAYTGEISASMLTDVGCRYVIIGHSERRRWFGEDDAVVQKKVRAALRHQLHAIVCLGESLDDREQGRTATVVTGQLVKDLDTLSKEDLRAIALAYEPVWAIGTGRAATPAQATEVHQLLRETLAATWGADAAQQIRILYGGSVTAENSGEFMRAPHVDGVLVGGACLDPDCFATIARSAEHQGKQGR
jgi:triosephosphate isomerase